MKILAGNSVSTMTTILFAVFVFLPVFANATDVSLAAPAGKVILTIEGKIGTTNSGATVDFDRAMLEALPQRELAVTTPWTDGLVTFTGPLFIDVLERAGADNADMLTATALNDYSVEIPVDHARNYGVILAMTMNGKTLRVRDKGPLWVIYPWTDENPELLDEVYQSRSIWHLRTIQVK